MNKDEELAKNLLITQGYNSEEILFEPDGNCPPDFLVEGRIAVEVRRLNQNYHKPNGSYVGLEVDSIKFQDKLKKLFNELGSPETASWFVHYSINRPVPEWKQLKSQLLENLKAIKHSENSFTEKKFNIGSTNFLIKKANKYHSSCFLLGGHIDYQAGGWEVSEMRENIELCIWEKINKTETVSHKYPEWWLILINHIAPCMYPDDIKQVISSVDKPLEWQRIIIVDNYNVASWFDLKNNKALPK